MARALIIRDHRSVGRIIAHKRRVAVRPSSTPFDPLLHGACRHEFSFLLQKIWSQSTERRDVIHNPNTATMRCQNKIVFPRLNCEIADGYSRKVIAFELRPVFSAIDRHAKTKFSPKKKQVGLN